MADSAQGRGRLHEMIDQRAAAGISHQSPHARLHAEGRARRHWPAPSPVLPAAATTGLSRNPARYAEDAGGRWLARPATARRALPQADQIVQPQWHGCNAAKRPIIILGGGALDCGKARAAHCRKTGCTSHHHNGRQGCGSRRPSALPGLQDGPLAGRRGHPASLDCILAVGSELSETDFWETAIVIDKNLIRIDIDPASLAQPHTAEIAILADAKAALAAIAAWASSCGTQKHHRSAMKGDYVRDVDPTPCAK